MNFADLFELSSSHFDEKIKHLERQVQLLNAPRGSHKLYSKDDCLKAFSWYTVSRSLQSKLIDYMGLPSISTLRNITRIAKNMGDLTIFRAFFSSQEERSRNCIVVVDEVHVQASVTYRGGFLKYRLYYLVSGNQYRPLFKSKTFVYEIQYYLDFL